MRLVSDVEQSSLQIVEMCSEGVWSPVCDYNWTVADATVVCRELGMSTGIIIILVYAMIVFGKTVILLTD